MNIEVYNKCDKLRSFVTNYFSRYVCELLNDGFHYIIIDKLIFIGSIV